MPDLAVPYAAPAPVIAQYRCKDCSHSLTYSQRSSGIPQVSIECLIGMKNISTHGKSYTTLPSSQYRIELLIDGHIPFQEMAQTWETVFPNERPP